ncbi:MAG TPA: NAD-binding protein [Armatimonadota bacterium]|nr:potassium channel protein [Armatimonadota bacterium]HOJ21583.1 NAD-binding protein [Armatimonadota bacterium]HOM81161.1 NAD-binding protein [Armatimonadota bacterium]HPO73498.1 NAD-binding protein [Armatimonadota bacterium]HPT98815.1 NAD-binding protein [Armatimonadota bacterium]
MPRRGERQSISVVMGHESVVPDLVRRLMTVLVLVALVTLVLWLDRAGLRDTAHPERPLELPDVVYFAVVTITTVGYGDIVPVTPRARLISTFLVTPMRIVVLILFIGTAYELVFQRYREAYRMRRLKGRLANHIIVCGYGVKGHATVEELICFGHSPDEIVVIDASADAARDAARLGVAALRGDATKEATLEAAVIEKATDIVVDVDRDDTTVLICLTAKHLNPEICVVAAAREAENVPLIYQSGADVVVAAPVSGGRMLAIATHLTHAPRFVDDILSFGRGLGFGEYRLCQADAGRTTSEIPELSGKLVLGVYHEGRTVTYERLPGLRLREGDVVIYLEAKPETAHGR